MDEAVLSSTIKSIEKTLVNICSNYAETEHTVDEDELDNFLVSSLTAKTEINLRTKNLWFETRVKT